MEILILILTGLAAGMLSGMFGIGGGIVIVPALVFFLGMTQHQAQGTSLGVLVMPIVALGAYNYYKTGNLDMRAALIIAAAFLIGGYFGSKISLSIDQGILKKIFGVLLIVVAVKMIFYDK